LENYKPLVFPIGLLLMILSLLLYSNVVELVSFLAKVWPSYSLIVFEVGIPLCLLMTAMIRGQGRKPS
jgi:spore germination protein KB